MAPDHGSPAEMVRKPNLLFSHSIRVTSFEIIRQCHILQHFPGLTETDLYLWLRCDRRELEASYGHHISLEEAARDLARRFGKNLPLDPRKMIRAACSAETDARSGSPKANGKDSVMLFQGFRKLYRIQ